MVFGNAESILRVDNSLIITKGPQNQGGRYLDKKQTKTKQQQQQNIHTSFKWSAILNTALRYPKQTIFNCNISL